MMRHATAALALLALSCGTSRRPQVTWRARVVESTTFAAVPSERVLEAARDYPTRDEVSAPMSLTASDGTGLTLVAVRAQARIAGPLAFTELRLVFENPNDTQVEGRFRVALPPGASIARLAMGVDGRLMEGEFVDKDVARAAFEDAFHRRVDPILMERAPGNVFSARIFPINAHDRKVVVVGWSEVLTSGVYRLPLAGLPMIEALDVRAEVVGGQPAVLRASGKAPARDFEVAVDRAPVAVRDGQLVVARISPEVPSEPRPLSSLLVLFDTSASAALDFADRVGRLRALVAALPPDVTLAVACFDQTIEPIFDGRAGDFGAREVDRILLRRPLGASDLEAALTWAGERSGYERLLLVTDGVATLGGTDTYHLVTALKNHGALARLDVILEGGGVDETTMRTLAARALPEPGAVLDARTLPAELAGRLERRVLGAVEIEADAAWIWPRHLDALQPGDTIVVHARLPEKSAATKLALRLKGSVTQSIELPLEKGEPALIARAVATARIAELGETGGNRAAVVELSRSSRVISAYTSLIVLESDFEYQRFSIGRSPATILTLGDSGLVEMTPTWPTVGSLPGVSGPTEGSVHGVVVDQATGAPLAGVTVVASAPSLQGQVAEITNDAGEYTLANLPAGTYELQFYYADQTMRRPNVLVQVAKLAVINARIDTSAGTEAIVINESAPTVDTGSTKQGVTLSEDYTKNVPVGRTFEGTLGTSVSGSTQVENEYFIDGLSVVDPGPRPDGAGLAARPVSRDMAKRRQKVDRLIDEDVEAALVQTLRWRAEQPTDLLAILALGDTLEQAGLLALAARTYGSIIDLHPESAEMRRLAGERLERLGTVGLPVAADCYARAAAERPEHPGGHRLHAFAVLRLGRPAEAFKILERALRTEYRTDLYPNMRQLLLGDLEIVAAAWMAADPNGRAEIIERTAMLGIRPAAKPSLRAVLHWETDSSDVDLELKDDDGDRAGKLLVDVSTGFGPEVIAVDEPREWPYQVRVRLEQRGPQGWAMGLVQVVRHDGAGKVTVEAAPFVLLDKGKYTTIAKVAR